MATTEFLTTAAERVQRWAARIWIEMPREIYWGKMMKEDQNAVIEVKRDLEGQSGDVITFSLARKLTGAGVTGDNALEGQEELLNVLSDTITLDQRRNAVRLKGKLSIKRTAFDQEAVAKTQLKTWLAETIDDAIFTQMDTNPSTVVFGGAAASSVATLTTAMTIVPSRIDTAVAKAKKADPKIWPVRVGGDDYFVLVIHPDVMFDLRNSAVWQGYQQNGGQIRGDDNPIFSGRAGLYNGVVVHEHEKIPVAVNGGANGDVPYASCPFLGRQAGLFAWGSKPEAWQKEFDYGNSIGFAIGAIWQIKKAVFSGTDHGLIALRVARTNN